LRGIGGSADHRPVEAGRGAARRSAMIAVMAEQSWGG